MKRIEIVVVSLLAVVVCWTGYVTLNPPSPRPCCAAPKCGCPEGCTCGGDPCRCAEDGYESVGGPRDRPRPLRPRLPRRPKAVGE